MIYVDNHYFDQSHFDRCFSLFEAHAVLKRCAAHRVAVRVTDPAFWLALCFYVKQHGGVVFPLASDAPREAARRRATKAGCDYLFFGTGEDCLETAQELPFEGATAVPGGAPCLVQMSSGTTGEPKVVERSWSEIDTEIEHYLRAFPAAHSTTSIVAAPVTHSYGLISGVMAAISRGEKPRVISNLNPKYVLRRISETPSPLVYSSPTLIKTLCALTSENHKIFSLITSGTTMQRAGFESALTKVTHLHQQYGCSEAGCITVAENIQAADDLGAPLSHLVVSAGESAEAPWPIIVHTRSRAPIDTGDVGYFESDRLRFVARADDTINVAGLCVYPAEVEEVVLEMPEVSDAAVFRKPHSLGHEQVALQFVSDRKLPSEAIRAWCAARLSPYQVPMSITQVADIPKLPNGKISRKALSEA